MPKTKNKNFVVVIEIFRGKNINIKQCETHILQNRNKPKNPPPPPPRTPTKQPQQIEHSSGSERPKKHPRPSRADLNAVKGHMIASALQNYEDNL